MKKMFNLKFIFGMVALLGLVSSMTMGAKATSIVFNQLPGDYEMFQGRNITTDQTTLIDPVSAHVNDTIEGVIYYHNNISGSTANNVKVAVTVPTTASDTQKLGASLWADGVTPITDTVIDGHVIGLSGLTIKSNVPVTLEVVPSSVRWFPERSQTAVALPNGQNGSELFSQNGLNLGNIQGCWEFAGFVMFRVNLKEIPQGTPVIQKSKSAFNDTQHVDARAANAKADDSITYTLVTKNTGTGVAKDYVIVDGINDILDYADVVSISNGGVKVNNSAAANRDDQVLIQYPVVNIGINETVTRTFVVKIKNPVPTTAQNGTAYDFVMFNIYGNNVSINIDKPTTPPSPTPTPTPVPAPTPNPLPATGVNSFGFVGLFGGTLYAIGRKLKSLRSN